MASAFALAGWLLLHAGIGLGGTWLARRYALRRNLMDQPGERRSHAVATPRGGGISIVAAMLAGMVIAAFVVADAGVLLAFPGAGLVAVAAIGWIDDHRPLSPWSRLAVHALAAGLLACAVLEAGGAPWQAVLSFLAALALVNVWNFMDGIDGLAASQAAIVATGYALSAGGSGPALWPGLAIAAGACGFLPFNMPRARIFLGDVGSGALGYGLACLFALSLIGWRHGPSWPLLLLPLSPFLLDAALTLCSRMLRGERWWEAHVQHAYQHWVRATGRHMTVTAGYTIAAVACVAGMLAGRSFSAPFTIVMIAAVWLAGGMVWRWLRGRSPAGASNP